jgi:hypothetical protein
MEFAWLDIFGGKWFLLNGNFKYSARSWEDEEIALAELREEGWTIAVPHRKRLPVRKPRRRICGYAMMRTIH